MKHAVWLCGLFVLTGCSGVNFRSPASAPTLYYIGEAASTTVDGKVTRTPYLLARTMDSTAGTIKEAALVAQGNKFAEYPSVMTVDGNKFTMTEPSGTVTGSGELTGEPWHWTYLRGVFFGSVPDRDPAKPEHALRIEDVNFLAEVESSIQGHKDFFIDGNLASHEDAYLHVVDKAAYDAKRAELLKK